MGTRSSTGNADELLTTKEAAQWLKCHPNTIYEYIEKGMPCLRLGGKTARPRFRFQRADIFRWAQAHTPAVGSTP